MTDAQRVGEWHNDAFHAWKQAGSRAIVETIAGNADLSFGCVAIADSRSRDRQVMVVVPGIDKLERWFKDLVRGLPGQRVGRRGRGHTDSYRNCDILVTTIQSATRSGAPMPRQGALLVADEVHRYGTPAYAKVLTDRFEERLGLAVALERRDEGARTRLLPYFGTVIEGCTFARGIRQGTVAPARVMTVSTQFSAAESSEYSSLNSQMSMLKTQLIGYGCRADPFTAFFDDVADLSVEVGPGVSRLARKYIRLYEMRATLLANCEGKFSGLRVVAPAFKTFRKVIVFGEAQDGGIRQAEALRGEGVSAQELSSGIDQVDRARTVARFISGEFTALVTSLVLDGASGDLSADVGLLASASASRRQMLQRMRQIMLVNADGTSAIFVVMYVEGTVEDPKVEATEDYLGVLTAVAQETVDVPLGDAVEHLSAWLLRVDGTGAGADTSSAGEVGTGDAAVHPAANFAYASATEISVSKAPTSVAEPLRTKEFTAREVLLLAETGSTVFNDGLLRCLGTINAREAGVLIRRFGLDGLSPRTQTEIAKTAKLDRSFVGELEVSGLRALQSGLSEVLNELAR